jgi:hypoxanthine phosphoribosyltransferase
MQQMAKDVMKLVPFCIEKKIGAIVGVPRSGLLPATLLASHLHVPLIVGQESYGGNRLKALHKSGMTDAVLVLDDTAGSGKSLQIAFEYYSKWNHGKTYQGSVYITPGLESSMDVFGQTVKGWPRLFEWNFLNNDWTQRMMFDMDGVLCVDPPPEKDETAYVTYIANALPKYVPTFPIGWICTFRLETRREPTQLWLDSQQVQVKNQMIMSPYNTPEERRAGIANAQYKASVYLAARNLGCILFVESHDRIASEIYEIAKQPVLSIESMHLYGGEAHGPV